MYNDSVGNCSAMNTMKEMLWTVLLTSVILQCFGEVDAYSVHLFPSPVAEVIGGSNLTLHCSYNGANTSGSINWYLNNDTLGLVIEASSCKYLITPEQYEIDRYKISCHGTKFTLSIVNISKDKDDQDIWKCDTTVIDMDPHHKASTTIMVINAGPADTKNGQFDNTVVITVVVVGVIGVIITVVGCFVCRKRRNVHVKNKPYRDSDHDKDQEQNLPMV